MTVEPRVVNVECRGLTPTYQRCYLISSTPVPAVLRACQEARRHGLYQKAFSEIAVLGYGSQYVWAHLDIDIIDIGRSLFEVFRPVAQLVHRLKFEREMQSEWFYYDEVDDVQDFINTKEIYIVPSDGLSTWVGATEEHYWPCGDDNVFYIDPDDSERVFRGGDGEGEISIIQLHITCTHVTITLPELALLVVSQAGCIGFMCENKLQNPDRIAKIMIRTGWR
ncbi:hypothetical protein K504DRAFT_490270 [Pleomassaria siparia CBS 279.74]|uniref:2EXR domain-containing protein n=1 Tax=Pleomassaria siparia CBS 279.74 TaxID=1314801 RepID=A0A6G1KBP0_9PLEO|nr:hypothetical protein K504DRAFT_490270 [Pleomassaria siparia CBS 279.74]